MIRFITCGLGCLLLLAGCGGDEGDDAGNAGDGSGSSVGTNAPPAGGSPSNDSPGVNRAPAISGTPVTRIWEEDAYVFVPRAVDPDGDALTFRIVNRPRWALFNSVTGRLQGAPSAADVGTSTAVRIWVSDGEADAWLPPFDITVEPVSHGSITLTWTPPSENTDDSVLDDLTGFNIYWGTDPDNLTYNANVTGGGITSYVVDDLSPGRYYFATTALNSFGAESTHSDFAVVVVR